MGFFTGVCFFFGGDFFGGDFALSFPLGVQGVVAFGFPPSVLLPGVDAFKAGVGGFGFNS
jgi:hypothetical protein